jgi:coenzyme F420-reducing hydrogenase alpha subunit
MDSNDKIEGLNGELLDKETFNNLFNNLDTYIELPAMLERTAYDVSRSEFDPLKEHSICYHMAGLTELIYSARKALNYLENESKILGMDLEDHMDYKDYKKYHLLKEVIKNLP